MMKGRPGSAAPFRFQDVDLTSDLGPLTLRTPGGEGILEAQEVEEIESAAFVAVGIRGGRSEGILEAQEIEEVELAVEGAVGVADVVARCEPEAGVGQNPGDGVAQQPLAGWAPEGR